MYRGNGASIARIIPYAALHYMSYEQYRRWIMHSFPDVWKGPTLDLVAGSFSGGTAVLFTYPLDLIRTKLAYQVRYIVSLSVTVKSSKNKIVKENCLMPLKESIMWFKILYVSVN